MRLFVTNLGALLLVLGLLRRHYLFVILLRLVFIQIVGVFKIWIFCVESPPLVLLKKFLGFKIVAPVPIYGVKKLTSVEFEQGRHGSTVFLNQGLYKAKLVVDRGANFVVLWEAKIVLTVMLLHPFMHHLELIPATESLGAAYHLLLR